MVINIDGEEDQPSSNWPRSQHPLAYEYISSRIDPYFKLDIPVLILKNNSEEV